MSQERPRARKPDHVPAEKVVEFDFYNVPGSDQDVQLAYRAVQQSAPDIFWTPFNGGHWVATRAEDIEAMQRDYERFSHRKIVLPEMPDGTPRQIPLEVDPPEHTHFRRPLTKALLPGVVNGIEPGIRKVAVEAIEGFLSRGECEFIEEFAKVLPIHVFLDLVDLPRSDKTKLLPLAEQAVRAPDAATRGAAHLAVNQYLESWVAKRREQPGEDLLSQIVNATKDGEKISNEDAVLFATLVLFGGLDTVASMLGFVANFLARNPEHRHALAARLDDEVFMRGALDELLRRHGIANTARKIAGDFEYKGLEFRAGEMILPANLFVGLDERANEDPTKVDFERSARRHATFGNGVHVCPGAALARRELRIFLEEWLRRIPEFQIKPGTQPVFATGMVNGVLRLELSWPPLS